MKTRYKIRKEQLERVVESFVMESTNRGMVNDSENLTEVDKSVFLKHFNGRYATYYRQTGKKISPQEKEKIFADAEKDSFNGTLEVTEDGLVYVPSGELTKDVKKKSILQRMGMGTGKHTKGA
jgi:hypothetical protein